MGGHGALTIHLRHPETYPSVSAFAPICNPTEAPWGKKTLSAYLGDNREAWREHDATELVRRRPSAATILIDQGTSDEFLETNLMPENFAEACADVDQGLKLRMQPGYDHSYYFIQTFMEDHLRHHAANLRS
jgi:S-formylglutathione hydrolase